MIKIGATTWVSPDEVAAVKWDMYSRTTPLVILKGGYEIHATDYSVAVDTSPEGRQEVVLELLRDLGKLPAVPDMSVSFSTKS